MTVILDNFRQENCGSFFIGGVDKRAFYFVCTVLFNCVECNVKSESLFFSSRLGDGLATG